MYFREMKDTKTKVTELFSKLPDPREQGRCLHKLEDILFIAFCTLLSNGEDYEDMVEFGNQREGWLRTILELPNGIPSHDTFNRVFKLLSPAHLQKLLESDGQSLLESMAGQHLILDGKKLKGASPKSRVNKGLYVLNAWVSEQKLCIGQKKVGSRSNEITAIPLLLDELEIANSLVSIDAIGCQKKIAEKICSKQANYLLSVKQNQRNLYEMTSEAFIDNKVLLSDEQWEYDHGRYETRYCEILEVKKVW